jgi:hypothetical protein
MAKGARGAPLVVNGLSPRHEASCPPLSLEMQRRAGCGASPRQDAVDQALGTAAVARRPVCVS